jgi:hypothetical protein
VSEKNEICTDDVEFVSDGSDAGLLFKVTCPECGDWVNCALYSGWWETRCQCGYEWSVKVEAVGKK